jgi:hypothetical protein
VIKEAFIYAGKCSVRFNRVRLFDQFLPIDRCCICGIPRNPFGSFINVLGVRGIFHECSDHCTGERLYTDPITGDLLHLPGHLPIVQEARWKTRWILFCLLAGLRFVFFFFQRIFGRCTKVAGRLLWRKGFLGRFRKERGRLSEDFQKFSEVLGDLAAEEQFLAFREAMIELMAVGLGVPKEMFEEQEDE